MDKNVVSMDTVENKVFLDAVDVANILNVSEGRAYSLIRQFNRELENKGHCVFKGKVSKQYFYEKLALKEEGKRE